MARSERSGRATLSRLKMQPRRGHGPVLEVCSTAEWERGRSGGNGQAKAPQQDHRQDNPMYHQAHRM